MATLSFTKSIRIAEKSHCCSLISALEKAERMKDKDVHYSRPVHIADEKESEKLFGAVPLMGGVD